MRAKLAAEAGASLGCRRGVGTRRRISGTSRVYPIPDPVVPRIVCLIVASSLDAEAVEWESAATSAGSAEFPERIILGTTPRARDQHRIGTHRLGRARPAVFREFLRSHVGACPIVATSFQSHLELISHLELMERRRPCMMRRFVGSRSKSCLLVAFTCLGLSSGVAIAQETKLEDFNSKNFDGRSTSVDNAWFPLKPGTRFVYEGSTVEDDGKAVPRRVVFTVTDLTKVIDGVRAVVVWDVDYKAGKLSETELAFFAQDNDGNVWHLGQYPEEWEKGKFAKAPAWLHGREDARAGIAMKVKPQRGTPSYSQGWGPKVNWTDRAVVDQVGQKTCVRKGCYEDVLVIAETSREEPDAEHLKYYARGVGNIRVGWRGKGEKTKETLELVEVVQLDPKALAEASAKALDLEKRAYMLSKKVYGGTPPADRRPVARSR